MNKRNEDLYIKDTIEAIKYIQAYTKNLSFKKFSNDQKTIDAVIRNFEIIGEATKQISKQTKARYPAIPWRKIASMRDKVIHEYFGVDLDIIWETIHESLPSLKKKIERVQLLR